MKSHRTPRYLWNRSREWWFQHCNPTAPWLGPKAVQTLAGLLTIEMAGLECGAGRSTLWVARRVRNLISLEENESWYGKVLDLLARNDIQNTILERVVPQPECYQNRLSLLAEESLDFALVDSEHCRDLVSLELLPKLKAGGFLMLDNANWFLPSTSHAPNSRKPEQGPANELWTAFQQAVAGWQCIWTSSGVTDTAFFIKPQERRVE